MHISDELVEKLKKFAEMQHPPIANLLFDLGYLYESIEVEELVNMIREEVGSAKYGEHA